MKKRLLTLGALSAMLSVSAQDVLTFVADKAEMHIQKNALVYNGGGLKTKGSLAKIVNKGNVMVVGDGNDGFVTEDPNVTGGNIVLKLNDEDTFKEYGQLYIEGLDQANITGVVDKEYKANNHGAYQQLAIPFYDKVLDFKHNNVNELTKSIVEKRWSNDELLVWNNGKVRFDHIPITAKSAGNGSNNMNGGYKTSATSYYALGASGNGAGGSKVVYNAKAQVVTVHGKPYAAGQKEILKDAGLGIDMGANTDTATWAYASGGKKSNFYREKYNTYVLDSWEKPWQYNGNQNAGFGKNLYQFGNPYLVNIDLSVFASKSGTNEIFIENLKGARLEYGDASTKWDDKKGSSLSTVNGTPGFLSFTKDPNQGNYVMAGDVESAIVKPMGTFALKLADNSSTNPQELQFDKLRTFRSEQRYDGEDTPDYTVLSHSTENLEGGLSTFSKKGNDIALSSNTSNTLKQLAVFALDENDNVIDRTYYVVSNYLPTGYVEEPKLQVRATSGVNSIATFEESKEGGLDQNHTNYFLYINEANENDFRGKAVPMALYNSNIKKLRFEIRENLKFVGENGKTKSGESFYISNYGKVEGFKELKQYDEIETNGQTFFSLYFGSPSQEVSVVEEVKPLKPSSTLLVKDESDNKYKVLFDTNWKKADVQIYDMSGRLVKSYISVNTKEALVLDLVDGVYVVRAISEKGEVYTQKVR